MIVGLLLKDFAIAKKVELAFDSNLIVITGETGAGKTILMKAIAASCGSSISSDVIRSNAEKAQVEASFTLDDSENAKAVLLKYDLLEEDNVLILSRTVYGSRTKASVNGHFVPIKILNEIGRKLIDMHGQHDVQTLLKPENHLDVLDRFGGPEMLSLREEIHKEFLLLRELKNEIKRLEEEDQKYRQERDFIEFEINELENANLSPDEEEELRKEEKILSNSQEFAELIESSKMLLTQNEEASILDLVDKFIDFLSEASRINPDLNDILTRAEQIKTEIRDFDRELSEFEAENIYDPEKLSQIQERLSFLSTLKIKYRKEIPELIDYLNELKEKSESFSSLSEEIETKKSEVESLISSLEEKCAKLNELREQTARVFEQKVLAELKDLAMEHAEFKVQITQIPDEGGILVHGKRVKLFPFGTDVVEFRIAPNPGEGFKPLASVASGGELSRIMLAIKRVIAKVDNIPTLAFDEVDAGIGGKTGEKVAEKLYDISKYRQVICITHLPQIASLPAEHFVVEKKVENGETFLTVKKLTENERVKEIARMISGTNVTDTTIKQAEELLRRWR